MNDLSILSLDYYLSNKLFYKTFKVNSDKDLIFITTLNQVIARLINCNKVQSRLLINVLE